MKSIHPLLAFLISRLFSKIMETLFEDDPFLTVIAPPAPAEQGSILNEPRMSNHRIRVQKSVDENSIERTLSEGAGQVILQFVDESSYDAGLLQQVDQLCQRHGARINIRFYSHNGKAFDLTWLQYLPHVRSLNLDCLTAVENIDQLASLDHLEEFAFGVFEADFPDLLRIPSLTDLRKLILAASRKKSIDLEPLGAFLKLESLFINSHARNLRSVANVRSLHHLSLASIAKKHSLSFIAEITDLESLRLILGGRDTTDDFAHPGIEDLEILRVRGLANVDLALFPKLERLRIEDQLQLTHLDVSGSPRLRSMIVWNCRRLSELRGLRQADKLEKLFIGQTAVDPEAIFQTVPDSLQSLSLTGYSPTRTNELKERIKSLGYSPVSFP